MPVYHSEQRHIESVRKKWPDPVVMLHPETAKAIGLTGGEWVRVVTPHGSIRMKLHPSDAIDRRMADAQHGWWFPERKQAEPDLFGVFESNANVLCPFSS